MEHTKEHFTNLITPYLPKNSIPHPQDKIDEYCLIVTGKLNSDESRPSKPAKTIRIIISLDTVEDYSEAPKSSQEAFDEKLINFVKTKVYNYNPEHDEKLGQLPPVEIWHVPFGITYY